MTSNRFDPEPGKPYGHCLNCGETFQTPADADTHMRATSSTPDGGHPIQITNPTRPERIANRVTHRVNDAIGDLMEGLYGYVERDDATADEITDALNAWYPDIADIWANHLEEVQS